GEEIRDFPAAIEVFEKAEPVYVTVPGWKSSTVGLLDSSELPGRARAYVELLEKESEVAVGMVSTGPRREETLIVDRPEVRGLIPDLGSVLARRGVP
ncbi:MAG: adenylosuccinate synthetase, partial [Acidobacteriota bacterium]